jgi:hypothetical protein
LCALPDSQTAFGVATFSPPWKDIWMSFGATLLIAMILISIGTMPTWAYSRNWGYVPSGSMGTVALVVLLMLALGKL